jgi:hypothetical protein
LKVGSTIRRLTSKELEEVKRSPAWTEHLQGAQAIVDRNIFADMNGRPRKDVRHPTPSEIAEQFPPTFGLKDSPGSVFRINTRAWSMNNDLEIVLGVEKKRGDTWSAHDHYSVAELKRNLIPDSGE